jgi:hypothetical protein
MAVKGFGEEYGENYGNEFPTDSGYGTDWGNNYGNDAVFALVGKLPISYYLGLITSQYQNSPKFLALVESLITKANDASLVLDNLMWYFDLDQASGIQLDAIGEIVQQNRRVNFQPVGVFSPLLDDSTYRTLIKAKIVQNIWDGKINSLFALWRTIFPADGSYAIAVTDNQDMTATITMTGTYPVVIRELIEAGFIVPKPQGVSYFYSFA